jgi:putative pyruvate formate lyase activating enzyme
MTDLGQLWVWRDPALVRSLGWYADVAGNRKPALFRIAATIPASLAFSEAGEAALWDELDRLTPLFLARWGEVRDEGANLPPRAENSLVDLCRELAWRMLGHCNFCRWDCRVDRRGTKLGACKLGSSSRVSSHFHHTGEELVYRGEGSGTVFFTSCNMRCAFCQNGDISTDKDNGEVVDERTLATMAWLLRMEGCHNVNWVGGDPTIHMHTIIAAIALLGNGFTPSPADLSRTSATKSDRMYCFERKREQAVYAGGFDVPMLWNSNFFMTAETMKILRLLIDVWLPDFKFGPGRCAMNLAKTPWYWETVTGNLALVHQWGEDFTIRHLVMPNHVECCTYPVLDWVSRRMPEVPINIMDQYHPDNFCDPRSAKYRPQYAELTRRCSRDELRNAYGYARALNLQFETISFEKYATDRLLLH